MVGFQNCPNSSLILYIAKIVNVFHLGNLLNEFHHAEEPGLNFKIEDIQEVISEVILKVIQEVLWVLVTLHSDSILCELVTLNSDSLFYKLTALVTDRARF